MAFDARSPWNSLPPWPAGAGLAFGNPPRMTPQPNPFNGDIRHLTITELHSLGDDAVRSLLAEFVPLTHASEIAIWAKDPGADQLVALLDTSGPGGGFELKVTQPLNSGIVSQVYHEQTNFLDQGLWRSKQRSPLVDQALHQLTQNEMCVPFRLAGHRLGVMSAVQLTDRKHQAPTRWGFDEHDLKILKLAAQAVGQAMERSLLAKQLGR